jgi:hypothetical protein
MLNTTWINHILFSWFDSSNATHNVLLGSIGSILATIITASVAWAVLKTWGQARRFIIDDTRKTRRYLKFLERLARLSLYWETASFAQRSQFIVLRISLIIFITVIALACQSVLTFAAVINAMQENSSQNIVEFINASKNASKNVGGVGVALIQQQYIMPSAWALCALVVTTIFLALTAIIYIFKKVRHAEMVNIEELLHAINSIRVSLDLAPILKESETLQVSHSLLYP